MQLLRFVAFALVFMGVAQARPVVLEDVAILASPDASWTYLGRFGVAIDGDFALVSAERYPPSPWEPGTVIHEAAALLYQRSGSSWNYVGMLGGVGGVPDDQPNGSYPGLAMKNGVAMTHIGITRIFERVGNVWTETPISDDLKYSLRGRDIEIDAGRILVSRDACDYRSVVLRKINGAWAVEGEFVGTDHGCGSISPLLSTHDLDGNNAVIFFPGEGEHIRRLVYEEGTGWRQYGGNITSAYDTPWGPHVAAVDGFFAVSASRERGTRTGYPHSLEGGEEIGAWSHYGLQPVDAYLQPEPESTSVLEHAGALFAQRNYSHDRGAYVYNLFRLNEDPRAGTLVGTLQSASGNSLGNSFDSDGIRAIVSGRTVVDGRTAGDNTIRVFQIPASLEAPAVQNHDFESATAGAAWQTSGGAFSFARVGYSRVYRQSSVEGNPAAWLPESATTNQSVQAEVTIRALPGSNSWVGLAARRSDAANYYYVTLRSGGTLELKRMVGGVFTTLASAAAPVSVNRKYRLRLEAIGTTLRVFRDDRLVLRANDSALTEGTAGIIMNRASADYDNVIVTPNPFTTIYTRNFSSPRAGNWDYSWGSWQSVDGVFRQSSEGDYARVNVGADTDDQIVQVRVRPTKFVEPDNWVGILLRDQGDGRNHAYVSLRGRGVISLWRRTNGAIEQLGTRNIPVTTGTWYDLRVETVAGLTRVFVNNELQISTNADLGPTPNAVRPISLGRVGLITRKATADFDDFRAYQP